MNRRNHSLEAQSKVTGNVLFSYENTSIRFSRSKSYYKKNSIPLESVYTSICKKMYPLIIKIDSDNMKKTCNKHYKVFSFFCFTCESHFCLKCQSDHIGHSFINFIDKIISEKNIINQKN